MVRHSTRQGTNIDTWLITKSSILCATIDYVHTEHRRMTVICNDDADVTRRNGSG